MTDTDSTADWDAIGYVKASKNREAVMRELHDGTAMMPLEIAENTDIPLSSVSRAITQLRNKKLVQLMNPDATRGRLYKLTGKGKAVKAHL